MKSGDKKEEIYNEGIYKNSLTLAVQQGRLKLAKELLKTDINPNEEASGYFVIIGPPIYYAFVNEDFKMVKLLSAHGADVNPVISSSQPGQPNFNLLNWVIQYSPLVFIKKLIKGGVLKDHEYKFSFIDSPTINCSLLMYIVIFEEGARAKKLVKILLTDGFDVNKRYKMYGKLQNVLDAVIFFKKNEELVPILKKFGAKKSN